MTTMAEGRLMTVPQVAARLGIKESTVLHWLRNGRLKGFRMGGTRAGWRVEESDIDAFIAARRSDQTEHER